MDFIDLRSKLLTKGDLQEQKSGKHFQYYLSLRGRKYRITMLSHGRTGQIDDRTLGSIHRQMRLTRKELTDFVNCPLSREEWLKLWDKRNPYRQTDK
ncbi:MAG: hypothetical protein HYX79_04205 [Chloroflexi bacterium]|nr:hypothetical protein [Chloroflexota bacterium]